MKALKDRLLKKDPLTKRNSPALTMGALPKTGFHWKSGTIKGDG